MILGFLSDHASVVAAAFSALAAIVSAVLAWRVPSSVAKLSERLRRAGDAEDSDRRTRLQIFATVMQERAAITQNAPWSTDAVRALNLIDVAFRSSRDVRDSWADLYRTFQEGQQVSRDGIVERMKRLLQAMAKDLGFGSEFGTDDFHRVYHPRHMADEELRQALERRESIQRLAGGGTQTTNTSPSDAPPPAPWPPRPA